MLPYKTNERCRAGLRPSIIPIKTETGVTNKAAFSQAPLNKRVPIHRLSTRLSQTVLK